VNRLSITHMSHNPMGLMNVAGNIILKRVLETGRGATCRILHVTKHTGSGGLM
jgi:hypothetical protein